MNDYNTTTTATETYIKQQVSDNYWKLIKDLTQWLNCFYYYKEDKLYLSLTDLETNKNSIILIDEYNSIWDIINILSDFKYNSLLLKRKNLVNINNKETSNINWNVSWNISDMKQSKNILYNYKIWNTQ